MKKTDDKTNVMRVLDQKKINYLSHNYESTGAISGMEVASALGQDPNMTFKTLVTVGKTKNHCCGRPNDGVPRYEAYVGAGAF